MSDILIGACGLVLGVAVYVIVRVHSSRSAIIDHVKNCRSYSVVTIPSGAVEHHPPRNATCPHGLEIEP